MFSSTAVKRHPAVVRAPTSSLPHRLKLPSTGHAEEYTRNPYRNIRCRHAVKKQPRVRFKQRRPELTASLRYVESDASTNWITSFPYAPLRGVYNICRRIIAIIFPSSSSLHSRQSSTLHATEDNLAYRLDCRELATGNVETSSTEERPSEWDQKTSHATVRPYLPHLSPLSGRQAYCRPDRQMIPSCSERSCNRCCRQCRRRGVKRPTSPSVRISHRMTTYTSGNCQICTARKCWLTRPTQIRSA